MPNLITQQDLVVLLKDLQALPKECEWAEFKINDTDPAKIGQYLSALSNSACLENQPYGFLVFGIEDESHRLVGTNFHPATAKKGNEELENWLAVLLDPRIDFTIHELDYEDKQFVIFQIEATREQPVKFQGRAFIRVGSIKKPLDAHPEKERKIWNKTSEVVFEKRRAMENLTEAEVVKLIDYKRYFKLIGFQYTDDQQSIINKLTDSKLIEKTDNGFAISNLSAIQFAKEIGDFETIARKSLRVIIYEGNNRVKTKKEQLGRYGYAVGFEGLIKYILEQLPASEQIGAAFRQNVSAYPPLAIRELVANAIIHQDFNIPGTSPMIEIFDNRVEISNPGVPLIDPLRFVDHLPQSRNELLARSMRLLTICEERGSGIDKVVFECERYHLPAPTIVVDNNFTKVILHAPTSLSRMDRLDKIRTCYLHACLKQVSGEALTNQSLRERFEIKEENYSMVSRIISDTKKAGLIKDYDPTSGSKTYAKYVPFWA